jgi:hypothetical protein
MTAVLDHLTPTQVCGSSDVAAAGAAKEAAGKEGVDDIAPALAEGIKYRYERYQGNGKSPGPLRVVGPDGSETAASMGEGGYVDVGGGSESVQDLAAQLSSLQYFQV